MKSFVLWSKMGIKMKWSAWYDYNYLFGSLLDYTGVRLHCMGFLRLHFTHEKMRVIKITNEARMYDFKAQEIIKYQN